MPQSPRIPQRPQGSHRLPDGDAWPQDQGRPEDSARRRIQRPSHPGAEEWHAAPLVQASYDRGDFRPQDQYGPQDPVGPQDQYGEPGQYPADAEYEDEYESGHRFVPGFGDDGDGDRPQCAVHVLSQSLG